MTKPTTVNATKMTIWITGENSPTGYERPCGLTTRGIDFSANMNEIEVPDCDDPDAPAWVERAVKSLQAGVSGAGVLALESLDTWQTFFANGLARPCKIVIDHIDAGYWSGDFILSRFQIQGENGDKAKVDIALSSDGEVAFTPAT